MACKNLLNKFNRNIYSLLPFTAKRFNSTQTNNAETPNFSQKIFSGIQPTGSLHMGNYLGAIRRWTELQNAGYTCTYCIVDLHSITVPQEATTLRKNILELTATLLACGIDPKKSTLFLQSAVHQHAELNWILGCMTTMARLQHLPQYKEKSSMLKEIPLGLYVYPVLQAADILLYKATHVPVGADQVQHLQLAQHLARTFNNKYGETFPVCHAMVAEDASSRLKSLRDPSKKMSKSDPDAKSCIYLSDKPDVILEKIKKSITDFTSAVTYEPESRLGVSNLILIHSLMTSLTPEEICVNAATINTGRYKLQVAEAVIEHLNPIRKSIEQYMADPEYLWKILEEGNEIASYEAERTIQDVKNKTGLGKQIDCSFKQNQQKRSCISKLK